MRVAELYLRGRTQTAIAAELGVNQSTVSRDLGELRDQWLQSALIDFNAAKARELVRIDNLEAEAWDAWDRSRKERVKTATEKQERPAKRGQQAEEWTKAKVEREQRDGDPSFLRVVQWCIDERCRILGLHEAAKLAVTHDWREAVAPEHQSVAEAFFNEVAEQLAQRMEQEDQGDGAA